MSYRGFTEAKSSRLNLSGAGNVPPVQGSVQGNGQSPGRIKEPPRGWEPLCGRHSSGGGGGGTDIKGGRALLFHIFSLYYYKTLHGQLLTSAGGGATTGTERQK